MKHSTQPDVHYLQLIACRLSLLICVNLNSSSSSTMAKCGDGYQMTLSWVPDKDGHVPKHAIEAGPGVYVCRAEHDGEKMPGKVVTEHKCAYVCYAGQEHQKNKYEVLCNTAVDCHDCYRWKHDSHGNVPKKAVVAGISDDGSPLYILHFGHPCAYFPYGGEEVSKDDYEVLVWMKDS
ncbi:hypothetical protein EG68_08987 [Paragonimus skrjabini miyazakii]|uniref:Uncharacterized protein n=1 Tax=Paragonimus skrjabini miyazakii TaxID=59628 RepID=A0A8S9YNL5_9TREM|nr:hypothetical protein EG68_08987 [Paragonimus skrjabini miyazakii]